MMLVQWDKDVLSLTSTDIHGCTPPDFDMEDVLIVEIPSILRKACFTSTYPLFASYLRLCPGTYILPSIFIAIPVIRLQ